MPGDTEYKKGQKKGPGRPPGTPNKTTSQLKDMVLAALDGAGGVEYLQERAMDPKTASAFLTLVGKVLPMQVAGIDGKPIQTITRIELVAASVNSSD